MLTDVEIEEIADKCMVMDGETGTMFLEITEFAHAIIAAYSSKRPLSLEPFHLSERLPGPEDCDAGGKCWWFNPGQPAMSNPHIATSSWRLCRMLNGKPMGTHWTPANSLPLPNKGAE